MGVTEMSRPEEEIRREIQIIMENIRHAKEDLKNPNYDDEQKETLRSQISDWQEQIERLKEQLPNP